MARGGIGSVAATSTIGAAACRRTAEGSPTRLVCRIFVCTPRRLGHLAPPACCAVRCSRLYLVLVTPRGTGRVAFPLRCYRQPARHASTHARTHARHGNDSAPPQRRGSSLPPLLSSRMRPASPGLCLYCAASGAQPCQPAPGRVALRGRHPSPRVAPNDAVPGAHSLND